MSSKRIVIVLCIVFVLAPLFFFVGLHYLLDRMKVRLLCKTDHQALLEACNKLSKQVTNGELKPGKYMILRNPDPEVSKFPRPILELRPKYVYLDDNIGYVLIEMTGVLEIHFGVRAYPEDFKASSKGFEYGDKELIPRLWYYDDGYRDNPEYEKKIEALIQKSKMKKTG